MLFVTGPLHAGKRAFVRAALGWDGAALAERAVWDVQDLAAARCAGMGDAAGCAALEALADELAAREVVVATEVGCGVVPLDAGERAAREAAGRLSCLLAARADTVVRVCCGLPQVLKGTLPFSGAPAARSEAGGEGGRACC